MHISIVGGGLSGLATAYYLLKLTDHQVTLFDEGQRSHLAVGLLHPFPGEKAKLSAGGLEAFARSMDLIKTVEEFLGQKVRAEQGIERVLIKESQRPHFEERIKEFDGVEAHKNGLLIKMGETIFIHNYLEGLKAKAVEMGLKVIPQKVTLSDTEPFDHTFLCAGKGIFELVPDGDLPIKPVKGQVLIGRGELNRSRIGKGHISPHPEAGKIQIGATYEHHFDDEGFDIERAKEQLIPKVATFYPQVKEIEITGGYAGVRVTRKEGYIPILKKIGPNLTAITALGSRGLLYHATCALQAIENSLK